MSRKERSMYSMKVMRIIVRKNESPTTTESTGRVQKCILSIRTGQAGRKTICRKDDGKI